MRIDELQNLFNEREQILEDKESLLDELDVLNRRLKQIESQIEELMPSQMVKPSTKSTLSKAFSTNNQTDRCGGRSRC